MEFSEIYRNAVLSNLGYLASSLGDARSFEKVANIAGQNSTSPASVIQHLFGTRNESGGWSVLGVNPGDSYGFSSLAFGTRERKALSIGGTQTDDRQRYLDIIQADLLELGLIGTSLSQAVSMVNYIERLRAPAGQRDVRQLTLHITDEPPSGQPGMAVELTGGRETITARTTVYYWLSPRFDGIGEGVFAAGDRITVTGHSLGGHLAALALRLFPTVFDTAVTFNAANFDPITASFLPGSVIGLLEGLAPNSPLKPYVRAGFDNPQQLTERLVNELFAAHFPGVAPDFAALGERLLAFVSEDSVPGDDRALIAGPVTGRAPAPALPVRTETNSHSMDQLMDSLAVYALFERIDPTVTTRSIERFFDASDADPVRSLEALVAGLDQRLLDHDPALPTVAAGTFGYALESDVPGTFARRAAMHARILALDGALDDHPGTSLVDLLALDVEALAARAADSAAVRDALLARLPYAVEGFPLPDGHALAPELFGPDLLRDRAAYVLAELQRRVLDDEGDVFGVEPAMYRDLRSDSALRVLRLEVNPLAIANNDLPLQQVIFGTDLGEALAGGSFIDRIYGFGGDDTLGGGTGDDVLEGGAGHDRLEGGPGRDTLRGGPGDDLLVGAALSAAEDDAPDVLQGGPGFDRYIAGRGDRIRDHDGALVIALEGRQIDPLGLSLRARFESTSIAVYQAATEPALWAVYVPPARALLVGGVLLEDFSNGDLGLVLPAREAPPTPGTALLGTADPDTLQGTEGPDVITALAGADRVQARGGDDQVRGGAGADELAGDAGADDLQGEAGRDRLYGREDDDLLDGGDADDLLSGDDGHDVLLGGAGADALFGGGGHDVLLGGDGDDFLAGSAAVLGATDDWALEFLAHPLGPVVRDPRNVRLRGVAAASRDELTTPRDPDGDTLSGEAGKDHLLGSAGDDWLDGGLDDDVLAGADGADHLFGGAGNDALRGGGGADVIAGGDGADLIVGHGGDESDGPDGDDVLDGEAGADRLHGGPGADRLAGGAGADSLFGDEGADRIEGGADDDELHGGTGNDRLHGDAGRDVLFGEVGNDGLFGGEGDDVLMGGADDDALYGEAAADQLFGEDGADALFGGDGNDTLRGGNHDDVLGGERGVDRLAGEQGNDLYVYRPGDGADDIEDPAGDNGLWLPDHADLAAVTATEIDADLRFDLGAGDRILVRRWREEGGLAFLRYGEAGYLARESFLTPATAGQVVPLAGVVTQPIGSAGDDLVTLAAVDGTLDAAAGADRYVWDGSGAVDLRDQQGANVLQFGPGLTLAELAITGRDGRYVLATATGRISFAPGSMVRFVFDGGAVLDAAAFDTRFAGLVDPPPRVVNPAGTYAAFVAAPLAWTLPAGQFLDLYAGDELTEVITGRHGAPLPSWLSHDPVTRTLYGTPPTPGIFELEITARDRRGQSVVDRAQLEILPALAPQALALVAPAMLASREFTWVERFRDGGAGTRLVGVGDLNGDGFDDVLELGSGRVTYGRRGRFGSDFPSALPDGTDGFTLVGFGPEAWADHAFDPAGYRPRVADFNGDHLDDVLLGSRVLFGQRAPYAVTRAFEALPLATPAMLMSPAPTLPVLHDGQGRPLDPALLSDLGDVNGDGLPDVFTRLDAARGVVVFGSANPTSATLDVTRLPATHGYSIDFLPYPGTPARSADNALDYANWGTRVAPLGDVNGDHVGDFAIGGAPYLFEAQSALVAIVFGSITPRTLSLADLDGTRGFFAAVPAVPAGIASAKSAAPLGDVDGDGYDDLLIGSAHDPAGSYVLYGQASFATTVQAFTPGDDLIVPTEPLPGPVYAGAGDDRIVIGAQVRRSVGFGGSGNDDFSFAAERGTHYADGGPGNDRYTVYGRVPSGRYELHVSDDSGHNVLHLMASPGGALWLRKGSLVIDLGDGFPQIHLEQFDAQDVLGGPRTIDAIEFADGTRWSYEALLARGFDLVGTAASETITGTNLVDRIDALAGDDRLAGAAGDDELAGGAGNDVYVLAPGDGNDRVLDTGGDDVLAFAAGITAESLDVKVEDASLRIAYAGGTVELRDWFQGLSSRIERFRFADGSELDALHAFNHAPTVARAPAALAAQVGAAFDYRLPTGVFHDPDPYEVLQIAIPDALPGWLTFDPAAARLTGTPTRHDVGKFVFDIEARDLVGASVRAPLAIEVQPLYSTVPSAGDDRIRGTAGADVLRGLAGHDELAGEAGNDWLFGGSGDDRLDGGPGNDLLIGDGGSDWLSGGPGDDLLLGGAGRDRYRFGRGFGRDRILEAFTHEVDIVEFEPGITPADVYFRRGTGAPELLLAGGTEVLSIGFLPAGAAPAIDEYRFADGSVVLAADVQRLIGAMAGFAPLFPASEALRSGLAGLAATPAWSLPTLAAEPV